MTPETEARGVPVPAEDRGALPAAAESGARPLLSEQLPVMKSAHEHTAR